MQSIHRSLRTIPSESEPATSTQNPPSTTHQHSWQPAESIAGHEYCRCSDCIACLPCGDVAIVEEARRPFLEGRSDTQWIDPPPDHSNNQPTFDGSVPAGSVAGLSETERAARKRAENPKTHQRTMSGRVIERVTSHHGNSILSDIGPSDKVPRFTYRQYETTRSKKKQAKAHQNADEDVSHKRLEGGQDIDKAKS